MEQPPQLLVYKASAGSGKTFTLAVQYIRQLVENPSAYRKILAVTFTNKATAEMKERILSQLYGIATQPPMPARKRIWTYCVKKPEKALPTSGSPPTRPFITSYTTTADSG